MLWLPHLAAWEPGCSLGVTERLPRVYARPWASTHARVFQAGAAKRSCTCREGVRPGPTNHLAVYLPGLRWPSSGTLSQFWPTAPAISSWASGGSIRPVLPGLQQGGGVGEARCSSPSGGVLPHTCTRANQTPSPPSVEMG